MTFLALNAHQFRDEIMSDLPRLIAEHPNGVYLSHMQEEYGESTARIKTVLEGLATDGKLTLLQSASHSFYVLPTNYKPPTAHPELTPLQRMVLFYLQQLSAHSATHQIRSNYSELARIIKCSHGGIKSCLERLETLQHIRIVNPSSRGVQTALLIQVIDIDSDLDLTGLSKRSGISRDLNLPS